MDQGLSGSAGGHPIKYSYIPSAFSTQPDLPKATHISGEDRLGSYVPAPASAYTPWGGKTRDKVRVYASPMTKENDPEALKQSYQALKDHGFTAAKIFVNGPVRSEKMDAMNFSAAGSRKSWKRWK